ncbi:unnamed protein product, partial [Lymnaea stagnalis]
MATPIWRLCFLAMLMASCRHVLMLPLGEFEQDQHKSTDSKGDTYCCRVRYSTSREGHVVDCNNCGITSIDTSWMPRDTVSLTLDNNNITDLQNSTFARLKSLRYLSIAASNVSKIKANALQGLDQLDVLNLEANKLPLKCGKFPKTMFSHVPNLRELYIAYQDDGESHFNGRVGETGRLSGQDGSHARHTKRALKGEFTETMTCDKPLQNYSDVIDIFRYLKKLTALSFDGLNSTLYLGEEFSSLTGLINVTIHGPDVTCITNLSFIGLRPLNVRVLSLVDLDQISVNAYVQGENDTRFDDDAFRPLTSLTHLTIDGCRVGNQNIARKMRPFVNTTMTSITLRSTHFWKYFNIPRYAMEDAILLNSTMQHLSQINLSHFSWIDSHIFAVAPRGLNSPVWQRSIKSMDFSNNNFGQFGWKLTLFDTHLLKNIQTFIVSSRLATHDEIHPTLAGQIDNGNPTVNLKVKDKHNAIGGKNAQPESTKVDTNIGPSDQTFGARLKRLKHQGVEQARKEVVNDQKGSPGSDGRAFNHADVNSSEDDWLSQMSVSGPIKLGHLIDAATRIFTSRSGVLTIALPPSLSNFTFVGVMAGISEFFNYSIRFIKTENFTHLYFMNNGEIRGTGHVYGLTHLQLLDLTGSTFIVEEHFLDSMTNLRYLILKSIKPDDFFVRLSCDRLIRYLTHLMYLDLTENNLKRLPHRLFATNPNVTHFLLAKNRFSGIPFDLRSTPNLEFLDLTGNAIVYLSQQELDALSRHANRVPRFFLGLAGNNIACMCFQTKFLAWIDNSKFLDMNGNYSCTYDNGHVTRTGTILLDLQGFSRQCNGSTSLMLSLILAFIMALAFLSAYLLSRFKTAIVAFTMKLLTTAFRPMTAEDYKTHVFI